MPQAPLENVVGHWNKLIEGFETSSQDFYTAVEAALGRRKIPGLKTARFDWYEGGALSPKREYLRVKGGRFSFDICAAPFGTGFFFSWWLVKRPPRWVLFFGLLFLVLWQAVEFGLRVLLVPRLSGYNLGGPVIVGLMMSLLGIPISFWIVAILGELGWESFGAAVRVIPLVGWFYERVFSPVTYYGLDTAMMLKGAVNAAVQETIDGLTTAKGLRALTEDERKPIFERLL